MDAERYYKLRRELVLAAVDTTPPFQNPNPPAAPPSASGAERAGVVGAARAERRVRQQKESALHCPLCNSDNTKFCYYNCSLQQPRYFCRTCRRYWTEGSSPRDVPVARGVPGLSLDTTHGAVCVLSAMELLRIGAPDATAVALAPVATAPCKGCTRACLAGCSSPLKT